MTLRAFWISAVITIVMMMMAMITGTLSHDDDEGSENVAKKYLIQSFKLYRVYLDPLNLSNVGDFSWS